MFDIYIYIHIYIYTSLYIYIYVHTIRIRHRQARTKLECRLVPESESADHHVRGIGNVKAAPGDMVVHSHRLCNENMNQTRQVRP